MRADVLRLVPVRAAVLIGIAIDDGARAARWKRGNRGADDNSRHTNGRTYRHRVAFWGVAYVELVDPT